jgi:hypothetical protein
MGHSLKEMDPSSLSEIGPSSWGIMVFEAKGPWRMVLGASQYFANQVN